MFGYDALSRLAGVWFYHYTCGYGDVTCNPSIYAADSSHGFSFDAVGNRTDNSGSYGAGSRIQAWAAAPTRPMRTATSPSAAAPTRR